MPAFKRNHLTLGTFPQCDVWPACHLIKYNVIVRLENVTLKKADEMKLTCEGVVLGSWLKTTSSLIRDEKGFITWKAVTALTQVQVTLRTRIYHNHDLKNEIWVFSISILLMFDECGGDLKLGIIKKSRCFLETFTAVCSFLATKTVNCSLTAANSQDLGFFFVETDRWASESRSVLVFHPALTNKSCEMWPKVKKW